MKHTIDDSQLPLQSEEFDFRVRQETELLKTWFQERYFDDEGFELGSEIEFLLLNKLYEPVAGNIKFVKQVLNPRVIVECGAAQLEINTKHYPLAKNCLNLLHQHITQIWGECTHRAKQNKHHLILIGSLPGDTDLYKKRNYVTPKPRYQLLNNSYSAAHGNNFSIILSGYEKLTLENALPLCISGLMSAFQLHLKVPFSRSVDIYNTIQVLSAPMVALAANSPYFNGKDIYHESRIFLFKNFARASHYPPGLKYISLFGDSYLTDSFWDLYKQNLNYYPRLLEEVWRDASIEEMIHLRQLNSVVHRWNRPILDFQNQKPHLRIEHRIPSAGPTLLDMVANAAFFYGLVNYFSCQPLLIQHLIPFATAKKNFYTAAQHGLDARITWTNEQSITVLDLLEELLPLAELGLSQLEIDKQEIDYYLSVIKSRITLKQNGATWQRKFVQRYGRDFTNLLAVYMENQDMELPVAQWKIG
ncbi:glutamate-cysteine ligase family protein [Legionella sp. km772]|uniref:glutamate-cysteine ligase family protein n=1 Tax=Legionella sp. km772 TaxID=2498111 RepID=UPI000F8D5A6D|nr:glutamate-cysteine ligase family protein [Legionella sp. km772]RUR12370.1 hypothetical protein ELY15_05290 [Legionella sp. km772]